MNLLMMNTLYRIQVGAFSIQDNAKKLLDEPRKKGFNGFITVDKRAKSRMQTI